MEKSFGRLHKAVVCAILMVFGVFVGFGEVVFLSKIGDVNVLGATDEKWENNLTIGEAEGDSNQIKVKSEIAADDARPLIIRRYLEKYKSPLVPYSDLIYQVSKDYGFEYYWIVAIAQQESNLCKKAPEDSHNCWGYGIHKRGTLKFDNYELAIKSYAEYLKREYFDKGLTTPELIMKKYCPSSDGSWARGVTQFINEMENGKL
jgi:hypothetical protein